MAEDAIVNILLMDVLYQLKENGKKYISTESAIRHFTSLNLKLFNVMALKNEKRKIYLVKQFLRDKKKLNIYLFL